MTVAELLDAIADFHGSRLVWWRHFGEPSPLMTVAALRNKLAARQPHETFTLSHRVEPLRWRCYAVYHCGVDGRGRFVLAVMER